MNVSKDYFIWAYKAIQGFCHTFGRMNEGTYSLKVSNTYSNIIRIALPISIAILIPQINILTNTIFLGYYQPGIVFSTSDMLAASGVAGIYYLTLVMICYGLSAGALMLMSRKAGENDEQGVGILFIHGVILSVLLSFLLIGISSLFAPYLFAETIHSESIQKAATSFIRIRYWGLPFIAVCQLCNSLFLSISVSRLIIYGSVAQTIVNIIFDYLLIFGKAGFPEMGLDGSALASVLSEATFFIVALSILLASPAVKHLGIRFGTKIQTKLLKTMSIKSSPLMVQYFLSIGAWEVFFIFVEHLGKAESALSQIFRSVFGLVGIAAWALASACNSMVSNLIGQGAFDEVIPLIKKIIKISFSVAFVIGLPILIFPTFFLQKLTSDASLVLLGIGSIRIVVLATWMLSVSTIVFNGVLGTGNTRLNMLFEFAAIILYLVYIFIVIEKLRMPLAYAWLSEFVYWLTLFTCSFLYFYNGRWKRQITA